MARDRNIWIIKHKATGSIKLVSSVKADFLRQAAALLYSRANPWVFLVLRDGVWDSAFTLSRHEVEEMILGSEI